VEVASQPPVSSRHDVFGTQGFSWTDLHAAILIDLYGSEEGDSLKSFIVIAQMMTRACGCRPTSPVYNTPNWAIVVPDTTANRLQSFHKKKIELLWVGHTPLSSPCCIRRLSPSVSRTSISPDAITTNGRYQGLNSLFSSHLLLLMSFFVEVNPLLTV
jgi:hypothetical protein